jgi:hypothetical protein
MLARLARVKDDPAALIDPAVVERSCVEAGHRWRERTLGPRATLEAMALQMLHGNTAMAHVVRLAGGGFCESAYCQARARLPIAVVRAQLRAFTLRSGGPPADWKGHRVTLIDGTGVSTPDTPELRGALGLAGGLGYGLPCGKLLIILRAHDGMILDLHLAPACTGDLRHAADLHPALQPGDVLVGDRGLCAYTHLAQLARLGCHGLFRMASSRAMPFPARRGPRRRRPYNRHRRSEPVLVRSVTPHDQLVEIVKPCNRPPSMSPEAFAAIPARLTVRAVRYTVRGARTRTVTLLTTLTDPQRYSAADLAALYQMRWRVETNLRHLKRTLGLYRLKCRGVQGVVREALMLALIYNAVCRTRALAAAAAQIEPGRVSFIDTLRVLRVAIRASRFVLPRPPHLKRWPLRPPRAHPRQLKRVHSRYPLMFRPRAGYAAWLRSTAETPN